MSNWRRSHETSSKPLILTFSKLANSKLLWDMASTGILICDKYLLLSIICVQNSFAMDWICPAPGVPVSCLQVADYGPFLAEYANKQLFCQASYYWRNWGDRSLGCRLGETWLSPQQQWEGWLSQPSPENTYGLIMLNQVTVSVVMCLCICDLYLFSSSCYTSQLGL